MKRFIFLFACLWQSAIVFSAADSLVTHRVREVVVEERATEHLYRRSAFSLGTRIATADSGAVAQLAAFSLTEYLVRNTSVFVKESGSGMMSGVSLRGTSASHTTVSWNGLNINPATMGQVDFSLLPLFFFDKIAVHAGGESALYGNGAIGGSIVLGSDFLYKKKWRGTVQQTLGSYGYSFSGGKIRGGTDKWQSHTTLMYNRSDNDFTIELPTFSGKNKKKQHNAAFRNFSVLQDFGWRISPKSELSVHAWHSNYFRQIQPSIQNNNNADKYEDIANRNTRLMAVFRRKTLLSWEVRAAFTDDWQRNLGDVISSRQLVVGGEAGYRWKRISLLGGVSVQYIKPGVYSYNDGISEWRAGFFALSRWQVLPALNINLNLRQDAVSDVKVPFTPSAGAAWRVFRSPKHELLLRGNFSRSFKTPTLNDRYWGNLDNRYLKSEDGINSEFGSDYYFKTKAYSLEISVSTYYNKIKNWIMWLPRGDIWKPQNIDLVLARGVEISCKQNLSLKHFTASLTANYAFNSTIVERGFNDMTAFRNRQIPLQPRHSANAVFDAGFYNFFVSINLCFIGERATSNVFDIMQAYWLTNLSLGYNWHIKKTHALSFTAQANNVFNRVYETVPLKAMPQANGNLSVKWTF